MKTFLKYLVTLFIILPGALFVLCWWVSFLAIIWDFFSNIDRIVSTQYWQVYVWYAIEIPLMILIGYGLVKFGSSLFGKIGKK